MKKRYQGFTLVELIVVIAIIGVLAAILIPSMLGYVRKARISAINSNARTLYNAVSTSLIEMDVKNIYLGGDVQDLTWTKADADAGDGASPSAKQFLAARVRSYFHDVGSLDKAYYRVSAGLVSAAAVQDGNYYGTHPNATVAEVTSQGYVMSSAFQTNTTALLDWAQKTES